jgi:hypothetical protein
VAGGRIRVLLPNWSSDGTGPVWSHGHLKHGASFRSDPPHDPGCDLHGPPAGRGQPAADSAMRLSQPQRRSIVEFVEPVTDEGYGLMTRLKVPGLGELGLYEPRHPSPLPAFD